MDIRRVLHFSCVLLLLVHTGTCFPRVTTERPYQQNSEKPTTESPEEKEGTDRGLYNVGLFEGDILMTPTEELTLPRNAISDPDRLWPSGALVYTIDPSVGCPDSWRCKMLAEAMDHLHEQGCVRFKQWTGEPYRVNIFVNPQSDACWSPVGRTGVAEQSLSLGANCWYHGIVLHELLHAVGFWHEMTRPDRDEFINVYWQNIMPGFKKAFYKLDDNEVKTLGEKFDYRSVMMYDEYAFSKDGVSLTLQATKSDVHIGPIWKKNQLSRSDTRRLHRLYSCQGNGPLSGFPYDVHCSFDANSCGFKNGGSKQWQWRRATDTDGFLTTTLPSSQSKPGYIQSATYHPAASTTIQQGCVRFWHFIESNSNSSYLRLLHAYLEKPTEVNFNPETAYELWSSDQISGSWRHVQIPLYVTRPFKLLFESSFAPEATQGTIALDDVEIFYSPCDDTRTMTSSASKRSNELVKDGNLPQVYDVDIPLD